MPDCWNKGARWFAANIEPTLVNHSVQNNNLLNPPSAISLSEEVVLNTAVFTDHQNGNLKIQVLGPIASRINVPVGFNEPTQTIQHVRIQYCISPDTFIECWESVGGIATIENIDGYIAIVFNAQLEMYFDTNGDWVNIESGPQIIDPSRTQSQQFTGTARFLPADPQVGSVPTNCDDIPTLLVNPAIEVSAIVTAQPPSILPTASNPLACADYIPNNTAIDVLSGPYTDAVFGDFLPPWYEVTIGGESAVCAGITGYVSAQNISFSNQLCSLGNALILTPAETGILPIMDSPDLLNGQRVCTSFSNASVILGAITSDVTISFLQWRRVDVLNGPCGGISGYVDELLVSVP